MDSGLRGARIGGAQISEKHCGFVINDGTATAADIAELNPDLDRDNLTAKVAARLAATIVRRGKTDRTN